MLCKSVHGIEEPVHQCFCLIKRKRLFWIHPNIQYCKISFYIASQRQGCQIILSKQTNDARWNEPVVSGTQSFQVEDLYINIICHLIEHLSDACQFILRSTLDPDAPVSICKQLHLPLDLADREQDLIEQNHQYHHDNDQKCCTHGHEVFHISRCICVYIGGVDSCLQQIHGLTGESSYRCDTYHPLALLIVDRSCYSFTGQCCLSVKILCRKRHGNIKGIKAWIIYIHSNIQITIFIIDHSRIQISGCDLLA